MKGLPFLARLVVNVTNLLFGIKLFYFSMKGKYKRIVTIVFRSKLYIRLVYVKSTVVEALHATKRSLFPLSDYFFCFLFTLCLIEKSSNDFSSISESFCRTNNKTDSIFSK